MNSPFACFARTNQDDVGLKGKGSTTLHSILSKESLSGKAVCLLASFALAFSLLPAAAFAEVTEGVDDSAIAIVGNDAEESSGNDTEKMADDQSDDSLSDDFQQSFTNGSTGENDDEAAVGENDAADKSSDTSEGPTVQPEGGIALLSDGAPVADDAKKLSASCSVIGVDADGNPQTWAATATYELDDGATAADLTVAMLGATGLTADYGNGTYGFYLSAITSPAGGDPLGWNEETGKYWHLLVNGVATSTGASGVVLNYGDSVTWSYYADDISVSCSVIGVDADGNPQTWAAPAAYELDDGATAADLTVAMLGATGLTADYGNGTYGFYLNTITPPVGGDPIGWDSATGKYWQLFVNGEAASTGASGVVLKYGDTVTWCYSGYGDMLPTDAPSVSTPTIDTGKLPDYSAEWPSFTTGGKNGAVVSIDQPISSVEKAWSFDPSNGNTNKGFSDPLIVNGDIYVISGNTIYKVDSNTGEAKKSAPTGFPAAFYFSRPSYANGMIFCAANDGRIAAFNADTLNLVWCTDALQEVPGSQYQNLSSITMLDGKVLAAFTAGAGDTCVAGTLVCVNEKDGSTIWTKTETASSDSSSGYYWTGACQSGNAIMIADDSGKVKLVNSSNGSVLASVSLGAASRSGVIALSDVALNGDGTYLAVSRDGKLHKIVRKGNNLESAGSVSFASASTSTPAVANGKAFICGMDESYNGTLSVVDLETMDLVACVVGGKGAAQGSPLVLTANNGDTYAYFTCNNANGAVYSYKLGDNAAAELYVPDAADQNYCTASLIADKDGNIYYSNDNHCLIKLLARFATVVTPQGGGEPLASGGSRNPDGESDALDDGGQAPTMFVAPSGSARAAGGASKAAESNAASKNASATERAVSTPIAKSALDDSDAAVGGSANGLPIWPIVGMVASIAVLAFIAIGRLRRR